MKRPLLLAVLAICCVLPFSSNPQEGGAKSQSRVANPETLAAVRPGMPRDAVVAGLSERYNLNKASTAKDESRGIETWLVTEKAGPGGGWVSFSNGGVRIVMEILTQADSQETISLVQDLYAYLKPEMKPYGTDTENSSKRRATVVVELEETHLRKGGKGVDMSSLKVNFKDVSYDILYSQDSLISQTPPVVKIFRTRGAE